MTINQVKWKRQTNGSNKESDMFTYCFKISKEINNKTNGFFNPAVYPLVNYWGFYSDW